MATNDTTARPAAPAADTTAPAAAPAAGAPAARAPAARAARRAPRARARARRATRARRAPSARRAARRAPRTGVGTTAAPVAVTPIAQAQQLAERIVQFPVGAAVATRDRVAGALEGVVSASTGAIVELRAEARRALGSNVETLHRSVAPVVAPVRERVAPLTDRVAPVRSRVESVVQNGLGAGRRFVEDAQDRIAKVA